MVIAPTIDKYINPCGAVVVEEEELLLKLINRHQERESKVRVMSVCKRIERNRELQGHQ